MNNEKLHFYFLLVALLGVFVLVFLIFRPFLYALALAAVFAVVFQPVYQKIIGYTRGRRGLAALTTIFIIIISIFTPLIFLGTQIFQEARQLYAALTENNNKDAIFYIFRDLIDGIQKHFPVAQDFSININQYFKQAVGWLFQHLGSVFAGLAKTMISFFIFLFALYYLLKDGQKPKTTIAALSPFSDANNEEISKKLRAAIDSVIKGNLLVAVIQGMLTATGFLIFGIPNAVLWGSVAAIAALIPGIGTTLVLLPAIIFLYFTGEYFSALGLFIWGVTAVGLIDNFLAPKLISRGTQLHPLIIFLSVLGGLLFFGPIGFLLGPLTITLFFALLDIYLLLTKNVKVAMN